MSKAGIIDISCQLVKSYFSFANLSNIILSKYEKFQLTKVSKFIEWILTVSVSLNLFAAKIIEFLAFKMFDLLLALTLIEIVTWLYRNSFLWFLPTKQLIVTWSWKLLLPALVCIFDEISFQVQFVSWILMHSNAFPFLAFRMKQLSRVFTKKTINILTCCSHTPSIYSPFLGNTNILSQLPSAIIIIRHEKSTIS